MKSEIQTRFFDRHTNFSQLPQYFNPATKFLKLNQVHGNEVAIVDFASLEKEIKADAAVTILPDLALTIHTADCLPLLAHGDGVVGACHAGWRGLGAHIIENWIAKMGGLGAKKENIKVFIGPAIGLCHFEVGKDVAEKIISSSQIPVKFLSSVKKRHPENPDKEFVDLKALARFKLLRLGIADSSIEVSPECTHCDAKKYFSYRRDGGHEGRLEAVIVKSQR